MRNSLLLILLVLVGCDSPTTQASKYESLSGETMGTTYSIKYVPPLLPSELTTEVVGAEIQNTLELVNRQMSNWLPDSEISRFNSSESTDWFEVSPETAKVLATARQISEQTDGAFDVTVAPLIELWGFGSSGRMKVPPEDEQLPALADQIGWEKLEVRADSPALKKSHPVLSANLSAIAKGYGVDAVAENLERLGMESYLVEIGGEIRVKGTKRDGSVWIVGVESPLESTREVKHALPLTDAALATSGDYRNFIEREGKKYSHTIDPRTLKPIEHSLASVSVIAETCMEADALATGLMVMGPETGYNYAEERGIPVLMMIHAEDGFREKATSAWKARFGELR
ncbi:MAG TPA: FAD:protein FMN transferase [Planctomycetaceae bacterium]|nr:FAD:protein FMN transferase [Planctomycetaceae bacterium]